MQYKDLPKDPGVYLFKNKDKEIIYVGKAKSLRKRVASYFNKTRKSPKTEFLVRNIKDIDFIAVDTEVEALLLENKLIKKHQPKYNISLKDAKTYAYLKLTEEKYPRLVTARKVTKKGEFFGPYTDGYARRELRLLALRLFKLRTCKTLPKRACLNYHIGLCTAPCEKRVTQEEYQNQIKQARSLLKGNTKAIEKQLKEDMLKASQNQHYEIALEKKRALESLYIIDQKQKVDLVKNFDQDIVALEQNGNEVIAQIFTIKRGVISGKKTYRLEHDEDIFEQFLKAYYANQELPHEIIVNQEFYKTEENKATLEAFFTKLRGAKVKITLPQKGEKAALMRLAQKNAQLEADDATLKELQDTLNLPQLPVAIECFDISHLGGTGVVAGMTRWVNKLPDKNNYRKFEIKSSRNKNDDFQAMREVVFRRYKRLRDENQPFPDLIIIDGGKGQLGAALQSLKALGLKIPIIALAKKREEIYLPDEEEPRQYDPQSDMMLYVRKVRNSVHNFVVSYQKTKRKIK